VLFSFKPRKAGRLRVTIAHAATAQQKAFSASQTLDTITPAAGYPARGLQVEFLQAKLAALGYATSRGGFYDGFTQRAVVAFRKLNGLPRITSADRTVFSRAARGIGGFHVRYPEHGRHVEARLSRQVLALIEPGGRVYRIYTTSSGKPSTPTVRGHFRFYSKQFGTNSHGMVHSSYFIRGYAIHGYYDVPTYAASHGCLRVPIPSARAIFDWVHIGDRIDVYY
jgi:peptidoglycan hydrolase-like protein with peptidoglycan-binding domain